MYGGSFFCADLGVCCCAGCGSFVAACVGCDESLELSGYGRIGGGAEFNSRFSLCCEPIFSESISVTGDVVVGIRSASDAKGDTFSALYIDV